MNVIIVAQNGPRPLDVQALLFIESFRRSGSMEKCTLYVAIPRSGPLWPEPTEPSADFLARYEELGAKVVYFDVEHFGAVCPSMNKLPAIKCLPENEPFMFLDTDQLVMANLGELELNFDHPSCRPATSFWPKQVSQDEAARIWKAVYRALEPIRLKAGISRREGIHEPPFGYYNGGCFYYRDPHILADLQLSACQLLWEEDLPELSGQRLFPTPVDQISRSVILNWLGGDGAIPTGLNVIHLSDDTVTWHYHKFSRFWLPENSRALALLNDILEAPINRELSLKNETMAFFHSRLGQNFSRRIDKFFRSRGEGLGMRDAGKLMAVLGFD